MTYDYDRLAREAYLEPDGPNEATEAWAMIGVIAVALWLWKRLWRLGKRMFS